MNAKDSFDRHEQPEALDAKAEKQAVRAIDAASFDEVDSVVQNHDELSVDGVLDDKQLSITPQEAQVLLNEAWQTVKTKWVEANGSLRYRFTPQENKDISEALVVMSGTSQQLSMEMVTMYEDLARMTQMANKVSQWQYNKFINYMNTQKQSILVDSTMDRLQWAFGDGAPDQWSSIAWGIRDYLLTTVAEKDFNVVSNFSRLRKDPTFIPLRSKLTELGNELRAERNRWFIAEIFGQSFTQWGGIEWSPDVRLSHLETMLKNARSIDVNTLALWLSQIRGNASMMDQLMTHIGSQIQKKLKDWALADGARFGTISYGDVLPGEPTPPLSPNSLRLETKAPSTKESFDGVGVLEELAVMRKNPGISMITLTLPTSADPVFVESMAEIVSDIVATHPNWPDIRLAMDAWATKVRLDALETTEKEFMSPLYSLKNLEYNQIGNYDALAKVIEAMPVQPGEVSLKEIVNNPSYSLLWWTVEGSASHVRTDHQWVYTSNERLLWLLGNPALPVNKPNDIDVTNNPTLAFDRAASFIDYLDSVEKIAPDASFSLRSSINGPTNAQMDTKFAKGTQSQQQFEQQRLAWDKEFQSATMQFRVKKLEEKVVSKTFEPKKTPIIGQALTVKLVFSSPTDKWWPPDKSPPFRPRLPNISRTKWRVGGSVDYSKCYQR
jgi:hypothetical protein